jgi:phosphatidylserine/phosphatidylglycerophosphate/cardiolipin synthase-like enzyme
MQSVALDLVFGRDHYDRVVEAVISAETSVWIATANLKSLMVRAPARGAWSMLRSFDALAGRGVEIRILHASLPSRAFRDELERLPELFRRGLELRMCPRTHFKAVIVDGRLLYLGSANWTGAGLGLKSPERRNFELGILTEDESLLDQVQGYYERIWRGLECKKCRLRNVCESPLDT